MPTKKKDARKIIAIATIIAVAILFATLFIIGLINSHAVNSLKLKITQTSWSGTEDYTPTETQTTYEKFEKNLVYVVASRTVVDEIESENYEEEILSFEVLETTADYIKIRTRQPFSVGENGIDLNSNQTEFTIKKGETLKLTTPTMDYGDIFILKLVEE